MCATGRAAVVLLLACATGRADDAPAFLQNTPHFYNAIAGKGFDVAWTAEPTTLPVDGELVLTLTVTGAANPDRVRRPDLGTLEKFKSRFRQITNLSDPPVIVGAKLVVFRYRLRPRDAAVKEIPELPFNYYAPSAGKLFLRYLDAIPITVRPAELPAPSTTPLEAPERYFQLPADLSPRTGRTTNPGPWHWTALVVMAGGVTVGGIILWRRWNPDGVRLARLRRNQVVRQTLAGLNAARRSADPVSRAVECLRVYLVKRHGLALPNAVADDVATAMGSAGLPEPRVAAVVELLRKCDAARFALPQVDGLSLVEQLHELIQNWEGIA